MKIQFILFHSPKNAFGWGSNFYKIKPMTIEGETWLSTEQYFHAMKFRGPKATKRSIEYSNLIKKSDTPMKAKMLGGQKKNLRFGKKWQLVLHKDTRLINDLIDEYKDVRIRPDWDKIKLFVMIKALYYKFLDKNMKKKLLTVPDNAVLVEHTRDKRWGDGNDGGTGKIGTNWLGKILTSFSWYYKHGSCNNMPKEIKKAIKVKL